MNKKIIAGLALATGLLLFFAFDLGQYLSLDYFNAKKQSLFAYNAEHPVLSAVLYFVTYVAITAISIPGAAIMTLSAGAIFGFWQGTVLASFASVVGACVAFLIARTLLRDTVQQRYGDRLKAINAGVEKDGAYYLFGLRLVFIFPFFVVNALMALTPIRLPTFAWVSQLGMLPATMAYVNAGVQLAKVDTLDDVLSAGLIASFLLLAFLPFGVKRVLEIFESRKVLARFDKPAAFDANVIVIGAGSAGLVSSLIAATVNAKAILIERHKMGGDCLNTGCVPSKALLRSAKMRHYASHLDDYGLQAPADIVTDFPAVMQRVQGIIKRIEPHDSIERYESLGVNCVTGEARLVSPWTVEVDGRRLSARNIIIASGARPFVPPIPGLDSIEYYTSDSIWELQALPAALLILGAGPIGCELAQAFARLGSKVTLVDMAPRILPREDDDAAAAVAAQLKADGVNVLTGMRASEVSRQGDNYMLLAEPLADTEAAATRIEFSNLLVAVGRKANTDGMGLEEVGVELNRNGTVTVNEYLRSNIPTIFACGDVAGPYQFTHTASHQAWYAAVNALFGDFKKFAVDYSVIPWATFTDPQVARVGLNEADAREQGIDVEVTTYGIDDLDRAIADGEDHGFVKVLTKPGSDKILGVTIVGYHASELISEFVLAMRHGLGLKKIMGTIHIYPTLAEANKFAAGEWRRANAPEKLLQWVGKYHRWRRKTSG